MNKPRTKCFFLVRGIPGSGRTSIAQNLELTYNPYGFKTKIIEANDFFMKDGVYTFNPLKLEEAHDDCIERTKEALTDDTTDVVIVTNTFVHKWEIDPYLDMMDYIKNIVVFDVIIAQGGKGSTHDVPLKTIEKMKRNFEEIPLELINNLRNVARRTGQDRLLGIKSTLNPL